MKKHNFNAGPAILPQSVFQKASEAVLNYNGTGLSLLEMSHRSAEAKDILDRSEQLPRELLEISDEYAVLFLTGGASSQFFMTAMNLVNDDETLAFVDTGAWSKKAIKEAKLFSQVDVIASSADTNYSYIPKGYEIPSSAKYLHLTSNNTIFGTQYHAWPETDVPFIADMSSDIFSKPVDVNRFGLIYAGAQKNMGPAGTTLVVVKKDLLNKVKRELPSMLNYETHIGKKSAYNTPPMYAIYVSMLTMEWVKEQGGVEVMDALNQEKAKVLYDEIDRNPMFEAVAVTEDRSLMNAPFVLSNKELEQSFLDACTEADIVGIKGHRSVGGFRASIYNALPKSSIEVLVDVMQNFEKKFG